MVKIKLKGYTPSTPAAGAGQTSASTPSSSRASPAPSTPASASASTSATPAATTRSPRSPAKSGRKTTARSKRRQEDEEEEEEEEEEGEEGDDDDEQEGNGQEAGEADEDEERDESFQQDGSDSSSSVADDDYLSNPIPLPDSSGDEYAAPRGGPGSRGGRRGRRRQSEASTPRTNRRESGRQSRRDSDADAPFRAPPTRTRGRGRGRGRARARGRGRGANSVRLSVSIRPRGAAKNYGEDGDDDDQDDGDGDAEGDDGGDETRASMDVDDIEDDEDERDEVSSSRGTPRASRASSSLGSRASTPSSDRKPDGRRRGGGAFGRGRGSKAQSYSLDGEELQLPIDPKGEEKIDEDGILKGGREYKAVTFTSPSRPRPNKLYILAIDAARCAGFRDSLYFFRRNPWIHKLTCTQEEKEMLIAKGRLHVNLKSRQVTIVTARNCFKVFGARFIKNGKNVVDDYYEQAALAKGLVPGSPAYIETYDPDIDNTTLAMPKIGNFSKALGTGRPAYMKMAKAFEMAAAPVGQFNPTPEPASGAYEDERNKRGETDQSKDGKGKKGGVLGNGKSEGGTSTQRSMALLSIPPNYAPQSFGLFGGNNTVQFGGAGTAPFGEGWERSKAKKPAPHLNGRNWMLETAKITNEYNYAINAVRKEYNAWHKITLGNKPRTIAWAAARPQQQAASDESEEEDEVDDEELEGVWPISGDEEEYETMEEYRKREGIKAEGDEEGSATVDEVEHEESEPDDRRRGRSPSPSRLPAASIKNEDNDTPMKVDGNESERETGERPKKLRRRRSPLRGAYDAHTMAPYIRVDTQPTVSYGWERVDSLPAIDHLTDEAAVRKAARLGIATVEYALVPSGAE